MKNKLLIILPVTIVAILAIACAIFFTTRSNAFRLDDQYYGSASIEPVSVSTLQQLVDQKSSFAVFVSQPSCRASAELENILQSFTEQHQIHFYEIAFSDLKSLSFAEEVRFYPSFLIFKNGQLVDFLEADNDEDAAAYTSVDGFETWFTKNVILRE